MENEVKGRVDVLVLQLVELEDGTLGSNLEFNVDLVESMGVNSQEFVEALDKDLILNFTKHVYDTLGMLTNKGE
jgi:hypothetical protein